MKKIIWKRTPICLINVEFDRSMFGSLYEGNNNGFYRSPKFYDEKNDMIEQLKILRNKVWKFRENDDLINMERHLEIQYENVYQNI